MEDLIEVSDAMITIRSSLGFLRDVKKKSEELGNKKRNTLFRATVFGTIDIIDKRKGKVSTSCLEKELDIVKDRIAMLEKCFKLRYHDTSEDSVNAVSDVSHQEVASEKRDWPGEASGFIYAESQDNKDHQLNDNILIGLVKPIDMMCGEVKKSDDKLDETLDVGVIINCSTLQSSPPLNAMDYQDSQPTDKGSVGFDDMMDPGGKDQALNDNVSKGLVKLDDTMSGEDNIDYKLDETVAGGVIVDRATLKEPYQTDKVDAVVFVDV
uniref:Uncharacterized protein n=1 Tax=Tanacetum cinerariifolium TaxID=118510 RepID=A0A699HAU0_TANCI|nr:hypothetical protein [Tanacetum cinerariifolium]